MTVLSLFGCVGIIPYNTASGIKWVNAFGLHRNYFYDKNKITFKKCSLIEILFKG